MNGTIQKMTVYAANCRGNVQNSSYPNRIEINCAADLQRAAQYDHVCAEYRDEAVKRTRPDGTQYAVNVKAHRSMTAFVKADCLPVDLDNDHSDNPADWKTLEDIQTAFPGVDFYAIPSRNHNKPKNGKSARPRYHIYFPIDVVTDAAAYRRIKETVLAIFPYFDHNAKDAARFLFGVDEPEVITINGGNE